MPITVTTDLPDVGQPTVGTGNAGELTVGWTDVINYGSYRVQAKVADGTWFDVESVLGEGAANETISGLLDGEEYAVRLRTETEHVTGSWTSPVTQVTTYTAEENLAASSSETAQITLTWDHGSNNRNGIQILRQVYSPDGWQAIQQIDDISPDSTTYIDTTVNPGRIYRYFVRSYTEHSQADSGKVEGESANLFPCSNGGEILVLGDYDDIWQVSLEEGVCQAGDVAINADTDMTLNLDDQHDLRGIIEHITGDPVMRFNLVARQPNAKADFHVRDLQPQAWYRLQFDGVLAKSADGRAHGETSIDGEIQFNEVEVPDN